ncbi:MAG: response regulator [Emcibacter sp.]|nr:response regulator [Emcibacter sp.]
MSRSLNDHSIFVEQVKLLAKQALSMIWLTMLTTIIISLVLLNNVEDWIPLFLMTSMLALNGIRIWHYRKLKRERITVENVDFHGTVFVVVSFLGGIVWGALGLLFPLLADPFLLALIASLLCGLVAGAVSYLSAYETTFFAYSIPCIMPFAIRCVVSQEEMLVAIGTLMMLYLTINLFICHMARNKVIKGIKLVRENKQLIEKLEHEKSNAENARNIADDNNKAKSRFLAAASHDLRQPLHAMGFFVEALQLEKDPDRIKSLTRKISQTSESLMNLLGSLLDISKIESGAMEPCRTHFNLNDVLVEIAQEFMGQAQEKGLDLEAGTCMQTVYSDKEMLSRIIRNLVSNAVRYTENGYVNISCELDGGQVIIRVSDSGIGIADNMKYDVFKEFIQINEGEGEGAPGLGLGLSIVEGLCRLLGYDISLRSELAVGSVFSLRVPLGNLDRIAPETPDLHILPGDVTAKTIILNNEGASLESISEIMRQWGHVIADFNTCAEVMEFLASEDFIPDLVISDMQLQDSTGIEAISAIQEKVSRKIPGIIMTGAGGGAVFDAVSASSFSMLKKPVQPAKLRSMVSYLVRGGK